MTLDGIMKVNGGSEGFGMEWIDRVLVGGYISWFVGLGIVFGGLSRIA